MPEVKRSDPLMEEKDFKQTVRSGRAKGNVETTKGFADEMSTVLERDVTRPFDFAHDFAGRIFDWRQTLRGRAHTGLIA